MIRFCSGFVFLAGLSILPSSVSAQTLDYGSTFYIGSTTTNMANIHADAVNDEVVNIIDDRQLEAPSPVASVDLSFTPIPKGRSPTWRILCRKFAVKARRKQKI